MTDISVPKGIRDFIDCDKCELSDTADSSYEIKMSQGNFADAIKDIDAVLTENREDVSARLCWVECQLRAGDVPVTALTSPLEELSSILVDHSDLLPMATKTYLLAGLKLVEREQTRLAVLVLQYSYDFAQKATSLSNERRNDVRSFLTTVIREEINRAEVRREKKAYIANLKEQLSKLENKALEKQVGKSGNGNATEPKNIKSPSVFNSKSIVQEAVEVDAAYVLGDNDEDDDIIIINAETIKAARKKKINSNPKLLFLCLLLMSVVYGAWFVVNKYFPKSSDASLREQLAMDSAHYMQPEALLPQVLRSATDGGMSAVTKGIDYNAVKERLEKLNSAMNSGAAGSSGKDGDVNNTNGASSAGTSRVGQSNAVQSSVVHPKQDIAASIQADIDRERARKEAEQTKDFEDNKPELDTQRLNQTVVDSAGDNDRRVALDRLTVAGDGRVYGQPQSSNNINGNSDRGNAERANADQAVVGRSPVDGSPVRPHEVREFPKQTYYRTITSTEVFSSPSLLAHSVARLEKGAKIEVVAQLGLWLEVVSQKGRKGYLYAQDAVKIE